MYNKKKKGRIRLLAGMVAVLLLAGSGLGYVQAENTESQNGQSSQELEETYQNWEIQDVDESMSENNRDDLASDLEATRRTLFGPRRTGRRRRTYASWSIRSCLFPPYP